MAKKKAAKNRTKKSNENVGCRAKLRRYAVISIFACVGVCGFFLFLAAISPDKNKTLPTSVKIAQSSSINTDEPTRIPTVTEENIIEAQSVSQPTSAKISTATVTHSATITNTPIPPTATVTPSATITNTVIPTSTITNTPIPSPQITNTPISQVYYVTEDANVRLCPDTTKNECSVVVQLHFGDTIDIVATNIQGSSFRGSKIWYQGIYKSQTVYVHSALVSSTRPVIQPTSSSHIVNNTSSVQSQPVQQQPQTSFTCDCSKSCSAMSSCKEAYFQLKQCNCSKRDGDHDGVPCENICPGG